ncbi:MAG TPA: DUF5320 domain-containing protein [Anaerolineae bacterium]|nr:DUF5320 domain-containing protein [Anaerolineae bacterium]
MPGFDGTGPQGQGPLTGRGEGYCAVRLPDEAGQPAYGYAGLQGTPVRIGSPAAQPTFGARFARWLHPATWPGRAFGRGRGAGRGRGRRFAGW